jgi:hypothetical protein
MNTPYSRRSRQKSVIVLLGLSTAVIFAVMFYKFSQSMRTPLRSTVEQELAGSDSLDSEMAQLNDALARRQLELERAIEETRQFSAFKKSTDEKLNDAKVKLRDASAKLKTASEEKKSLDEQLRRLKTKDERFLERERELLQQKLRADSAYQAEYERTQRLMDSLRKQMRLLEIASRVQAGDMSVEAFTAKGRPTQNSGAVQYLSLCFTVQANRLLTDAERSFYFLIENQNGTPFLSGTPEDSRILTENDTLLYSMKITLPFSNKNRNICAEYFAKRPGQFKPGVYSVKLYCREENAKNVYPCGSGKFELR